MLAGFVLATPVRRAVFLDVAAGESDLARIVAKNRLLRPAAERAANDFVEKGIVKRGKDGALALTDEGERLRVEIQRTFL